MHLLGHALHELFDQLFALVLDVVGDLKNLLPLFALLALELGDAFLR